ncbi:MAG: TetR/AcrR family transcriptional regulator C-terminal domain-containing protein [Spirillospora sp.]
MWSGLPLPDVEAVGWRAAAAAMATDLYGMFTRHPWLVQVFAAHIAYGEGKARHDDHHLAVYEAAGFSGAQADQAAAAVFTYALGNAAGAAAAVSHARRIARDGAGAEEQLNDAMNKAREIAMGYPHLRARLETPAADYAAAPDSTFEFGLQALLDGLERQLPERRRPGQETR